jgi:hypothetical protein
MDAGAVGGIGTYSTECLHLMESVGTERFCLNTFSVTADALIAAIDEVDQRREDINQSLNFRCGTYRKQQRDAIGQIGKRLAPRIAAHEEDQNLSAYGFQY